MNGMSNVKKLTLSAMFLAIGLLLPFLTGQIKQIGSMLCPMHIPVLLCGFFCGGPWGLVVGLVLPILRSVLFGMPQMFPSAICMAVELAAYGFVSGWIYSKLPKKIMSIYAALLTAMIVGRVLWGMVMFLCMGITGGSFGLYAFWGAAFVNAFPGIILQMVCIPPIVMTVGHRIVNCDNKCMA